MRENLAVIGSSLDWWYLNQDYDKLILKLSHNIEIPYQNYVPKEIKKSLPDLSHKEATVMMFSH